MKTPEQYAEKIEQFFYELTPPIAHQTLSGYVDLEPNKELIIKSAIYVIQKQVEEVIKFESEHLTEIGDRYLDERARFLNKAIEHLKQLNHE